MKAPVKPLLFLAALLFNTALFLSVPFLQAALHTPASKKATRNAEVQRDIALPDITPERAVQRQIKEIHLAATEVPNLTQNRPSLPGGGLKIDLSPAGGEGQGLVSGGDRSGPLGSGTGGGSGAGMGAMVYEPGQTDADARIVGPDQPPRYPPRAEREGITGYVDVLFVVSESGFATQISVIKEDPAGYGFAAAAVEAIRKLRFQPAQLQKTAVKQKVRRRVNFQL